MRFRMVVKHKDGGEPWNEDEDRLEIESMDEAQVWAKETVDHFNATLRPYEKLRELISVEFLGDESRHHDWEKTNLITIVLPNDDSYDTAQCMSCGITGKRWGLSQSVTLDKEFSAYGYQSCIQAKVLLERKAIKRKRKLDG